MFFSLLVTQVNCVHDLSAGIPNRDVAKTSWGLWTGVVAFC